jgi:creatinine amidohydrolase
MKYHLAGMNWMQVQAYLESDDRLILVLGACEQHGYLSLQSDTRIPEVIVAEAAQRTGVLVAPAMPFGYSSFFAAYPGTLSVSMPTLSAVVRDVITAAYQQGFRGILVSTGHGGNFPVWTVLGELVSELPGLRIDLQAWWESPKVEAVLKQHGVKVFHAGGAEAFAFNRVAPLPEGAKPEVPDHGILAPAELRRLAGDGVFGGPYVLADSVYDELLEAAVIDTVERLERLRPAAS